MADLLNIQDYSSKISRRKDVSSSNSTAPVVPRYLRVHDGSFVAVSNSLLKMSVWVWKKRNKPYSFAVTQHKFETGRAIKKSFRLHCIWCHFLCQQPPSSSNQTPRIYFWCQKMLIYPWTWSKCSSLLKQDIATVLAVPLATSPFSISSTKWPLSACSSVSYSTVNF